MRFTLLKMLIFMGLLALVFGGYGACVRHEIADEIAKGDKVRYIKEYVDGAFLFAGWILAGIVILAIIAVLAAASDAMGDAFKKIWAESVEEANRRLKK